MSLRFAVLTVSDSRTEATDTSGALIVERLTAAGHALVERRIVHDDVTSIREIVQGWIAAGADVVLATGGTGLTARDVTPEALEPLLTKPIPGFGELFRSLSYAEIGAATLQSRAFAGVAGRALVFGLPGSTGAVRLALEKILLEQLDATTKPCNFAELLPRIRAERPPSRRND